MINATKINMFESPQKVATMHECINDVIETINVNVKIFGNCLFIVGLFDDNGNQHVFSNFNDHVSAGSVSSLIYLLKNNKDTLTASALHRKIMEIHVAQKRPVLTPINTTEALRLIESTIRDGDNEPACGFKLIFVEQQTAALSVASAFSDPKVELLADLTIDNFVMLSIVQELINDVQDPIVPPVE